MLEDALLAEGCTNDELLSELPTSLQKDDDMLERDDEESKPGESGRKLGVTISRDNVFLGSVAVEVRPL